MTAVLAWVIGGGGLLGSHVRRALPSHATRCRCWDPEGPAFPWDDPPALAGRLDDAAARFAEAVRSASAPWAVFWCAGAGAVGSTAEALDVERAAWERVLGLLARHLADPDADRPGSLFLASSAGGVYAGSGDVPLTEGSSCRPISEYGRHKLRMEDALRAWSEPRPLVSYLVGRLSNLYGPGQNLEKPQGLISHVSRCILYHRPVHIYVSQDTVRDYLFIDDCAAHVARCFDHLAARPAPHRVVKIFASEQPATISRVLGIFQRLTKHRPSLVSHSHPNRAQQPAVLRFRSTVLRDLGVPHETDLATGISRVHQHQLGLFQRGRLHPPGS